MAKLSKAATTKHKNLEGSYFIRGVKKGLDVSSDIQLARLVDTVGGKYSAISILHTAAKTAIANSKAEFDAANRNSAK